MMLARGALQLQTPPTQVVHGTGPITIGAVGLIVVAVGVVAITYRHAVRVRSGLGPRHPRRGTSALLLGAIAAVVLGLSSSAQQPLASLTIVSGDSAQRTMTVVSPPRARGPRAAPRPRHVADPRPAR